jgi:hypothetical protein
LNRFLCNHWLPHQFFWVHLEGLPAALFWVSSRILSGNWVSQLHFLKAWSSGKGYRKIDHRRHILSNLWHSSSSWKSIRRVFSNSFPSSRIIELLRIARFRWCKYSKAMHQVVLMFAKQKISLGGSNLLAWWRRYWKEVTSIAKWSKASLSWGTFASKWRIGFLWIRREALRSGEATERTAKTSLRRNMNKTKVVKIWIYLIFGVVHLNDLQVVDVAHGIGVVRNHLLVV